MQLSQQQRKYVQHPLFSRLTAQHGRFWNVILSLSPGELFHALKGSLAKSRQGPHHFTDNLSMV